MVRGSVSISIGLPILAALFLSQTTTPYYIPLHRRARQSRYLVYGFNSLQIGLATPASHWRTSCWRFGRRQVHEPQTTLQLSKCNQADSNPAVEKESTSSAFPKELARYRQCFPIVALEGVARSGLWMGPSAAESTHLRPLVLEFFACAACTVLMHTHPTPLLVDVLPSMSSAAYAA
jgi:hypothetical protein